MSNLSKLQADLAASGWVSDEENEYEEMLARKEQEEAERIEREEEEKAEAYAGPEDEEPTR